MDNTVKFSGKVRYYTKYRPSYPKEFIDYLRNKGLTRSSYVADVGAGTGKLTILLSEYAGIVYAVEPNTNMRVECQKFCSGKENIITVDGTAENTSLQESTIDFITVAQAFHWFDEKKTKSEFRRILKPEGLVILVWNTRMQDNGLLNESNDLCSRFCPEFVGFSGGAEMDTNTYAHFFRDRKVEFQSFTNDRLLSLENFIGGCLSASYAPTKDNDAYEEFVSELTKLFNKYSENGKILIKNNTYSFCGKL